jgi:hypothetical protein
MEKQYCTCTTECARAGVSEDGSYGYFAPYNPFSPKVVCKRTEPDGYDIPQHIIKKSEKD